jgi:hypothetical protein
LIFHARRLVLARLDKGFLQWQFANHMAAIGMKKGREMPPGLLTKIELRNNETLFEVQV